MTCDIDQAFMTPDIVHVVMAVVGHIVTRILLAGPWQPYISALQKARQLAKGQAWN